MANTGQQKFKDTQISQTLKMIKNDFFFLNCTKFKVLSVFFTLIPGLCFILYVKIAFKIGKNHHDVTCKKLKLIISYWLFIGQCNRYGLFTPTLNFAICFQCEEIVHVHEVYFKLLQSEDEQTWVGVVTIGSRKVSASSVNTRQ